MKKIRDKGEKMECNKRYHINGYCFNPSKVRKLGSENEIAITIHRCKKNKTINREERKEEYQIIE